MQHTIAFHIARVMAVLTFALAAPMTHAALPATNPAGATLVTTAAEGWSAHAAINPAGVTLHLAGGSDTSLDSRQAAGAKLWLGWLDAVLEARTRVGAWWRHMDND